jgi:hypothetical protein
LAHANDRGHLVIDSPPRAGSTLLAEELAQQRVERVRALDLGHVPGVLVDDLARAGNQLGEDGCVADGDDAVAVAPDDQGGAGDLVVAVEEVLVEVKLHN